MGWLDNIKQTVTGRDFSGPCCAFCGNEPATGTRRSASGEIKKIGTDCKKGWADFPVNKLAEEQKWREEEEAKKRKAEWKNKQSAKES